MAYVNQEKKKLLAPAIKAVAKKYNVKVSLSIRHSSSLVARVKNAEDILKGYCDVQMSDEKVRKREFNGFNNFSVEKVMIDSAKWGHNVNEYWIEENYCEKGVSFLKELKSAMEGPEFFNEDDSMTDYFHRSHYIDIKLYA